VYFVYDFYINNVLQSRNKVGGLFNWNAGHASLTTVYSALLCVCSARLLRLHCRQLPEKCDRHTVDDTVVSVDFDVDSSPPYGSLAHFEAV